MIRMSGGGNSQIFLRVFTKLRCPLIKSKYDFVQSITPEPHINKYKQ